MGSRVKMRCGAYYQLLLILTVWCVGSSVLYTSLLVADGRVGFAVPLVLTSAGLLFLLRVYRTNFVVIDLSTRVLTARRGNDHFDYQLGPTSFIALPAKPNLFEPGKVRVGEGDSEGFELSALVATGRIIEPPTFRRIERIAEKTGVEIRRR